MRVTRGVIWAWAALLSHSTAGFLHAGFDSELPTKPSANAQSDAFERDDHVVVQTPMLGWVMDERDGYALVQVSLLHRSREHLLELHELSGPHLLRVLEFSSAIEHAALGPRGAWCIVALRGERQVLRVDLNSGNIEVIIDHCSGALALDDSSHRLAILGHIPHRGRESEHHGLTLGVWDLNNTKWIESVRTPVGNVHVSRLSSFATPVWSHDKVLVEGPDMHAMARRPHGYRWLTTLDLATGEFETVQGPPNAGWSNEWVSPLTAAHAERRNQLGPRLRERWNLDSDPTKSLDRIPDVTVAMVESSDNELVIAMQQNRGPIWTIHLDRQGQIRTGDFDTSRRFREAPNATTGRLLMIRRDSRDVYDYVEQETIATLPLSPGRHEGGIYPFHRFLPHGWIEVDRERLSYHEPGNDGVQWTIEFPQHSHIKFSSLRLMLLPASGSPDGRYVTIGRFSDPGLLDVRRSDTGKVLFTVPGRPTTATAFHAGGDMLAVASGSTFNLYAVPTGERLARTTLEMRSSPYRIIALDNGWWVVQALNQLIVLDEHLEKRMDQPIGRTLTVSLASNHTDPLLVLIGELGEVHVIGLHDGQVRRRWDHSLPHSGPARREGPLQAMLAFDGNVLIRSTGHAGMIELRRLPELDLVATIHSMIADDGQPGWVVSTPEGHWNASENAERFVQIINGIEPVGRSDVTRNRNQQEVRQRMNAAIRGER